MYEGNCGWQFDHRFSSFEDGTYKEVENHKKTPNFQIRTEYKYSALRFEQIIDNYKRYGKFCPSAFLGFRRVSRSTDQRTVIACIFPSLPSTYGWILSLGIDTEGTALLCGLYNSLVFDYLLRNSLSQPSIPQNVIEQVAVPSQISIDKKFVLTRTLELTYTSHDLKGWANDLGYNGEPFTFDPERRALLRAELDAYYAHLYGLSRDELRYILDPADVMGSDYPSETFRVLKDKEIKQYGEYRTRRLVLEAWDRLVG